MKNRKYKEVNIENHINDGYCALNYEVIIQNRFGIVRYICPFDKCNSFKEAIDFYFDHFHNHEHKIIKATIAVLSKKELTQLCMAC